MKIGNNYQNLDLTKTISKESKVSEQFPETIAPPPDLTPGSTDQAKKEPTANSESAKLIGAAQDALSRIRIENQFTKENKSTDSSDSKKSNDVKATPAGPAINVRLEDLDYDQLMEHTRSLIEKVDFSKLENVKEVVKAIAPEITASHLERLIGSGVNTGSAKGAAGSIRDLAGQGRDRVGELTGNKLGDLRMVGSSLVSDDPPSGSDDNNVESPSLKDIIINFFTGQGSSRTVPVPMPPVPPDAETGKNMWDGVSFFKNVLGIGNYENYVDKRGGIDKNGTPNPDAPDTGGPRFITREMLIGIAARLGSKGEPNPESQEGSGGPINETKASGGATGPAAEPAIDVDRASASARDFDAIRIRLESKFIRP